MLKVVCGVIFNDDQEILLTRRSKGEFAGKWEFPGGKLERGETYEECLTRELEEELSIRVSIKSHYTDYIYSYPNFSVNLIVMFCLFEGGEIKLTDHDKFSWVIPTDLKQYEVVDGDVRLVDKITSERVSLL